MTDLIARLEAATEGSRELDAEILVSVIGNGAYVKQSTINGNWCVYQGEDSTGRPRLWQPSPDDKVRRVEPFSQSIDAALTLVPEGWFLTLDRYSLSLDDEPEYEKQWRVWLKLIGGDIEGEGPIRINKQFGASITPALALCIAALKARELKNER